MKKLRQGDYLIIQTKDDNGKLNNNLLKLTSKNVGKNMHGVLEKNRAYEPKTVDFDDKQIIANLGPKPAYGQAYGCKVEPWLRTLPHDFWGDIHIFRNLTKAEKKALKSALDDQAQFFLKHHLGYIAPLNMEIRPKTGTYAGRYQYTGKEDKPDTMILSPISFTDEPNSKQEVVKPKHWVNYVICHEGAHGVWFRGCNSSIKARWIDAYHATMILKETDPSHVIKLGKKFVKSRTDMDDFCSGLDEEQTSLFDACVSWINDYHSLNRKHLKILIDSGNHDSIGKLWPQEKILDSDAEIPLGEYASKNPEEFFAEAFSLRYANNMKLPKNIQKLLDKTLEKVGRKGE